VPASALPNANEAMSNDASKTDSLARADMHPTYPRKRRMVERMKPPLILRTFSSYSLASEE